MRYLLWSVCIFYLLFFQIQLKYILQVQYIFLDLNVNWFENSEYHIRNIEDIISNCPDGTHYGMIMSVRASIRVSVRPSDSPFRSSSARFINFLPTCFDILNWNFAYVLQINIDCRHFAWIIEGVMPLLELRILEIQFSTPFSYMLWNIEVKFCIWLSIHELQIQFECHQFL